MIVENGCDSYNENPFAFDLTIYDFDFSSGDWDYRFDCKSQKKINFFFFINNNNE